MATFKLVSSYVPTGDQPEAIDALTKGLEAGERYQTLLGVTGSGKTFTMANVIARTGLPTLIVSHNKTLAAQLYGEFRSYFPHNAVGYFVSYYDYYQPEAYVPSTDTYIEKDASINEDIDRLRLKTTADLIARDDVVIIASVSCIYGLGDPKSFRGLVLLLECGMTIPRDRILRRLVDIQYSRNDVELRRGTFRVRGDVVEVFPAYDEKALRIEQFGDEIDSIREIDPLTGKTLDRRERVAVYPAKHFVTTRPTLDQAVTSIETELDEQHGALIRQNKLLEAERLFNRTRFDLEMLREVGYCPGIENYSRHMDRRAPGSAPNTLLDYFPEEFLLIIDESHVTIPQIRAMYVGDYSRKSTLVEYGFRLPSAIDNRPLMFDEFTAKLHRTLFVSATPGDYELELTQGEFVEQVIRPTGLVDPDIEIRPVSGQMDDLLEEVRKRAAANERVLVTTLTKRMAEDLTDYFAEMGVRVRYIHADVDAIERVQLLRGLRLAEFDVLVGINLLREGLDLPEVSLVAVLDADKEGYLRSARSLIQTSGRAARNVNGRVLFYADRMTKSMAEAIRETERRRVKQLAYNEEHGITPTTVRKSVAEIHAATKVADAKALVGSDEDAVVFPVDPASMTPEALIDRLTTEMLEAAERLEFERAASLRDRIDEIQTGGTLVRAGAPERLEALIRLALEEDIGTGDATTAATVPAGRRGEARIVAKAEGVVAGTAVIARVYAMLTGEAEVSIHASDGARVAPGDLLARIDGPFAALLTGERVVMNFLCHLSGIATRTRRFVDALEGTGAVVVDTRKTTPGLRDLEKAAVRAGGGTNHRFGLDDALLIKENHVAAAGGLTAAVAAAHRAAGERPVEVEVRSEAELSEALDAGARFLLLDNVTAEAARAMITSARRRHPDVLIEVSGRLDESSALAFARAGADRLSIGALTHSAPVLDLSMLIEAR